MNAGDRYTDRALAGRQEAARGDGGREPQDVDAAAARDADTGADGGYVRFQAVTPNTRGHFTGVFGLVNNLGRAGLLTLEEERFRRSVNAWYDAVCPNPSDADPTVYDPALHPHAAAWFKATAVHLVARVGGYLGILAAHGVDCHMLHSRDPGHILYEDDFQIVVIPYPPQSERRCGSVTGGSDPWRARGEGPDGRRAGRAGAQGGRAGRACEPAGQGGGYDRSGHEPQYRPGGEHHVTQRGRHTQMTASKPTARARLTQALAQRQAETADRWVQLQREREQYGRSAAEDELREEADGLVAALGEGLAGDLPIDRIVSEYPPLREAVCELSLRRARAGTPPTATALAVLSLKEALLEAVQDQDLATGELFELALMVNHLLDAAGALSFETYVQGREEIIRRQSRQLLELSTPVVQLWRKVLAVPLIGNLDTARSQVVMENLLEGIQTHEASVAIIDITGVPTVDTSVAQHLIQTVKAVRLMGADCVISGVRPGIAQTIVQLGIDLSDILTRATLADALATAMRLTGDADDTPEVPKLP